MVASAAFARDTAVDTGDGTQAVLAHNNSAGGAGKWWGTPPAGAALALQADDVEYLTVCSDAAQTRRRCLAVRALIVLLQQQQQQGGEALQVPDHARAWCRQQQEDGAGGDGSGHEESQPVDAAQRLLAIALRRLGALIPA